MAPAEEMPHKVRDFKCLPRPSTVRYLHTPGTSSPSLSASISFYLHRYLHTSFSNSVYINLHRPERDFLNFFLPNIYLQAYVIGQSSSMASIMTIEPESPSLSPSRSVQKENLFTFLSESFGWAKNLKKIIR